MSQRLLVITPVRNEAAQITKVAAGMLRQTRPPDKWIVIDDGSTDETPAILERLVEELSFMETRRATPLPVEAVDDHLAIAAEARAFNQALTSAGSAGFTHVAKLDGDIELPAEYFAEVLSEFRRDPRLGLAGGVLRELTPEGWKILFGASDHHIRGALKCYSTECFFRIGGMQEQLAWDTIDEITARMLGFRTRAFGHIVALHHRPLGSAEGVLRGRARHGRCDYIIHYPLWWVAMRSLKTVGEPPVGLSGIAFLWGYVRAAVHRDPRVQAPGFRNWVRRELAARALATLGLRGLAARRTPVAQGHGRGGAAHSSRALSSSQTF
jgi:biofilm PGA synthesis N-glycosyltransferase PgaC